MKTDNLHTFLKSLTDREFAFFFKYRRFEFMLESQEKIEGELSDRNLTEIQLTKLTTENKLNTFGQCPRCGANKFIEIAEVELHPTEFGGYEVEVNTRKCRVCAYNAQKDEAINWKVSLNKFFGKYRWKKYKR